MNECSLSPAQLMGLDQSHLIPVGNKHYLHKNVAAAFEKMRQGAALDGVDIQICSSFRSFDQQLAIWNRKWSGELPLNTLQNTQLNTAQLSDEEKIHAIMLWSALPGASRHHWGSDFDVYDRASVDACNHSLKLVPSEYEDGGPCGKLSQWILRHASHYGFYLPYAKYVGGVAQEPWHLSHKQVAKDIQKTFVIDQLYAQLAHSSIMGKALVLELLPELVKQYTFNLGPKDRQGNHHGA